ncbi:MAG: DAK2 domain-containing protein [Eggerthellaceae bacterium]|nr:DAK2 domain-containing protein [Eggerthellaceae bacterium]
MSESYSINKVLGAIAFASSALTERKEEVNRLNVFPVPDGDTGTNMSLTIESVVKNLSELAPTSSEADKKKAITTGALMGARGNSGVITSQILRGFCEGWGDADRLTCQLLGTIFAKAKEVAFQAVRKPVEGTILTVLKDCAEAAAKAVDENLSVDDALRAISKEAYESVERTPEYLAVLKENGVVDAGGFGLAILINAFTACITGEELSSTDMRFAASGKPKVEIEQINDWEDANFRYCNEFLVDSDTLDPEEALNFLASMGDCELCVGSTPKFKVHVHSNTPDQVLKYFLDKGQISEVHIHNMDLQSQERVKKLQDSQTQNEDSTHTKEVGFVAVAPGEGNADILKSLGVDIVVSGGQTMNPSTKDLLDAIERVNAASVIVLPSNSNIIMAANSACEHSDKTCAVVASKSVPQSFSAMFAFNENASFDENFEAMAEAISEVKTGEVTRAIKESKDAHGNPIHEGDVIGIADGSIEAVGNNITDVVIDLLSAMDADEFDNLTLLAGEDLSDEELESLEETIEAKFDELEIDPHRGGQPLYPLVFSLE